MKVKKCVVLLLLSLSAILWTSCSKENEPVNPDNPDVPENYEPPVVHVYSSDSNSEAVVKELQSDGTVVLDAATAKKIPQVGEVIVSGITEAAPLGFLYHVERVEQNNGLITIKTSPATLNEVLPDASFEQPLTFSLADDEEVAIEGNTQSTRNSMLLNKDFQLLNYSVDLSMPIKQGEKITFDGFEKQGSLNVKGKLSLGLEGSFIWDCKKMVPQRCGVTLDGSIAATVSLDGAIKATRQNADNLRWKFPYETKLKPIVFFVGPVPVVMVPVVQYYVGVMSSDGKVYMKWKPIDFEAIGFESRLIWSNEANRDKGHWDYGFTPKSDFKSKGWKDMLVDAINAEVGLNGEVKFAVWPQLRYELYNTEHISLAVGITPYASLSGEVAIKYQADNFNWDDFELKDNVSLSAGLAVPLEGKLEFNAFGKKIGGTLSQELDVISVPLVEGATFFPVFNDMVLTPKENVKTSYNVHVEAERGSTLYTLYSSMGSDLGFCYAQIKKDANGNEIPTRDWKYISLKSKSPYTNAAFKMTADIPTENLVANATYDVKPYWTMKVGSSEIVWMRKGARFTTGGSNYGNGNIGDVPGTKL